MFRHDVVALSRKANMEKSMAAAAVTWKATHGNNVYGVAFSHDNKLVASASADRTVALLDRATGAVLREFKGHNNTVRAVTFSPDSKSVASGGKGNGFAVLVWNAATLNVVFELKGHSAQVYGVAWSPDGRVIATASEDMTMKLWDAANGRLLFSLAGHLGWVNGVAFSSDSQMVVSCSDDQTAIVWNVRAGKKAAALQCESEVLFAGFDSANNRIVTACYNKMVQVWDATSWQQTRHFQTQHGSELWRAALSPDGRSIATIDSVAQSSIRLTDLGSGKQLAVLSQTSARLNCIAYSSDGQYIVVGNMDNAVVLWTVPALPVHQKAAQPSTTALEKELRELKAVLAEKQRQLDVQAAQLAQRESKAATAAAPDVAQVDNWSVEDVCAYLRSQKVDDEAVSVINAQKFMGPDLVELTHDALKEAGIAVIGYRNAILRAVKKLTDSGPSSTLPDHHTSAVLLSRKDVTMATELSSGQFGRVFRGTHRLAPVALKQPRVADDNVKQDFIAEANLMKSFPPHPNVVQYFGVCMEPNDILLVLELCYHGSLEDYLRKNPTMPVDALVQVAVEVAAGMAHLSSYLVHRDLATRNILLEAGPPPYHIRAKIADFGLSRPLNVGGYYRLTMRHTELPLPWYPKEICDNQFLPKDKLNPHTSASDVWMYGALLWEMFMGIPEGNDMHGKPNRRIPNPRRDRVPPLDQPPRCPNHVFAVMTSCWAMAPTDRPTFQTVHQRLSANAYAFLA